jgi:hypothetical protein
MKLKNCLELGKDCGLSTLAECCDNVVVHSTQLFVYSKLEKELAELYEDLIPPTQ